MICIFRPVVWTGAWTCHLTISQILNKSTKSSKNQNKPTQLPVTTTFRKMQYCNIAEIRAPVILSMHKKIHVVVVFDFSFSATLLNVPRGLCRPRSGHESDFFKIKYSKF